jgi:diguanylate cyclase
MNVTMSAGVSEVRREDSAEDILARADAALYRAKDAGRNQVIAA